MTIFNTEVFQGSLKKKNYFEGWYYKHVSADGGAVYAFIPGISLAGSESHAFIQVFNAVTGETNYITYGLDEFSFKRDSLYVRIGKSVFTDKFMEISIDSDDIKISGRIDYSDMIRYPETLMSPGIMGWYSYIPFMECNHGIVSAGHDLRGGLEVNGSMIDFSGGRGYIEKDWGASFPEAWIWIHSNTFTKRETSLFVSAAKIPWLGRYFMGFICFIYVDGTFYRFTTYNRSKISRVRYSGGELFMAFENRKFSLELTAAAKTSAELKAPALGSMSRRIKESIDSEVHVRLFDRDRTLLFEDTGRRTGLEIVEKIFEYFK
jgi:hypothetical protein